MRNRDNFIISTELLVLGGIGLLMLRDAEANKQLLNNIWLRATPAVSEETIVYESSPEPTSTEMPSTATPMPTPTPYPLYDKPPDPPGWDCGVVNNGREPFLRSVPTAPTAWDVLNLPGIGPPGVGDPPYRVYFWDRTYEDVSNLGKLEDVWPGWLVCDQTVSSKP